MVVFDPSPVNDTRIRSVCAVGLKSTNAVPVDPAPATNRQPDVVFAGVVVQPDTAIGEHAIRGMQGVLVITK